MKEMLFYSKEHQLVCFVAIIKSKKVKFMTSEFFLFVCAFRLEGQEKLVTAEGLYRRALSLDETNPEAQEALHKITDTIQVSGPQHTTHILVLTVKAHANSNGQIKALFSPYTAQPQHQTTVS